MKMQGLQDLLVAHRMPPGWLAGLIDEDGRLLARIPRPDLHGGLECGAVVSNAWNKRRLSLGAVEETVPKRLIASGSYDPDTLKVLFEAFDNPGSKSPPPLVIILKRSRQRRSSSPT
jgi:hypothetical protein